MALHTTNDIIYLNMKANRVKGFNDQMTLLMPHNSVISTKIHFRAKVAQ